MRVPRIYYPGALQPGLAVTLPEGAANHVARVLRLPPGAPLILFNGDGGEYRAALTTVARRTVEAEVGLFQPGAAESPLALTLAQGIAKGERMDYVMQKAVELGVTRIVPLVTEHCAVNLSAERQEKRLRHWQGVAVSACEQCGRDRLPEVAAPVTLDDWLQRPAAGVALVLDPRATQTPDDLPATAAAATLLIGPEGGLGEGEIERARAAGYRSIRLGPRILRTETAALTAVALVQARWGDLGRQGQD